MGNKRLQAKQERDGTWYRYRLPLKEGIATSTSGEGVAVVRVAPEKLSSVACDGLSYGGELVRINDNYKHKPYRYSYGFTGFAGSGVDRGGFREWGLVKMDAGSSSETENTKTSRAAVTVWKASNCYPSEPVFVARKEEAGAEYEEEDDGALLSLVYDGVRRESFLLVLDARDMTELARCYTGFRTCISFHGSFIPNNKNKYKNGTTNNDSAT